MQEFNEAKLKNKKSDIFVKIRLFIYYYGKFIYFMDATKINELTTGIISKIKEKRKLKGFSHENMAHELRISPSAYNKIERQETKLTVERLLQIQQVLDFSLTEIFELKTEKIYHQDIKDNGVGHQEIQNLYHDNKEMAEKFIQNLKEEILFLRSQLERK